MAPLPTWEFQSTSQQMNASMLLRSTLGCVTAEGLEEARRTWDCRPGRVRRPRERSRRAAPDAPAQRLAGTVVGLDGDPGQILGGGDAEVGALGQVVAQEAVHVLVAAALPGECGSQKETSVPVAAVISRCMANSLP